MAPRHRRDIRNDQVARAVKMACYLPAAHPVARLQHCLRHRRDVHRMVASPRSSGDGLHDHRRSRRVLPWYKRLCSAAESPSAMNYFWFFIVYLATSRFAQRLHPPSWAIFHADVFARGHHVHVGCDGSEQGNGRGVRVRRVPLRPDADRVHKRHSDGVRDVRGGGHSSRAEPERDGRGSDRRQLSPVSRDPSFGEESRMHSTT